MWEFSRWQATTLGLLGGLCALPDSPDLFFLRDIRRAFLPQRRRASPLRTGLGKSESSALYSSLFAAISVKLLVKTKNPNGKTERLLPMFLSSQVWQAVKKWKTKMKAKAAARCTGRRSRKLCAASSGKYKKPQGRRVHCCLFCSLQLSTKCNLVQLLQLAFRIPNSLSFSPISCKIQYHRYFNRKKCRKHSVFYWNVYVTIILQRDN